MLRIAVLFFAFIAYGILLIVVAIGMKINSRGIVALAAALCTFTTACILFYGLLVSKGVSSINGILNEGSDISTAESLIPVYTSSEEYTTSDINYNSEDSLNIPEGELNIPSDEITIAESVILDQNDVRVTVKGLTSGWLGPQLKILIENNSSQPLTFQIRDAVVNGYMADTVMSEDVAPGKKVNSDITFTATGLAECGISTFTDMEFKFHVFDADTWDTYLDSEPVFLRTSAADWYQQDIDDSGEVFYDQNGIRIVGKGLSTDSSLFGPGMILYIENESANDITVQVRDTSVNGFMIETVMSQDVLSGKKAITALTFMDSSLEENGITSISSVETSFHIFDMVTWDTIADSEPITIYF